MDLYNVRDELQNLTENKYRLFTQKLIPSKPKETILGVRIPVLRKLVKSSLPRKDPERSAAIRNFLKDEPYFLEELTFQSLCVNESTTLSELNENLTILLPRIDNWSSCDIISPRILQREFSSFAPTLADWSTGHGLYGIRFVCQIAIEHALGDCFDEDIHRLVLSLPTHNHYYLEMGKAWYIASAVCKNWDVVITDIERMTIDPVVHNLAIKKGRESRLLSQEQKDYLLSLKRPR